MTAMLSTSSEWACCLAASVAVIALGAVACGAQDGPGAAAIRDGRGSGGSATAMNAGGSGATAADAGGFGTDAGLRSLPAICVTTEWPVGSFDVWADGLGPYALVTASNGAELFRLDGGSWRSVWTHAGGAYGDTVVGFPGGDLLLTGAFGCSMLRLHAGATTCELTNSQERAAVVDERLAYALAHDRVLVFDGLGWTQYQNALGTKPLEVFGWSVWASEDLVAVGDVSGRVFLSRANGLFVERTDIDGDAYRVVWGLGERLWIGGRGGSLIALEGDVFTTRSSVHDHCNTGIRGLWGTGDTLYIRTEHGVFRYSEPTGISTLREYACDETVSGFWGRTDPARPSSPATLYVAVRKENATGPACELVHVDEF